MFFLKRDLPKLIPVAILIIIIVSVLLSRESVFVEFNTGMPVQSIDGLRRVIDALPK